MAQHGKGFDEHGNPLSKAFDLGGVDDDRLQGERILLYVGYNGEPFEWHQAQKAVAERQLQMDIVIGPSRTCTLDAKTLSRYSQLWYVSDHVETLSRKQVKLVQEFVQRGNGLLIWADNEPYYADANLLAREIVKTSFSGNKLADGIMQPGSELKPGHFVEHQLTSGVNRLYEGITICTIAPAPHLTILAQSHDGQYCMACYEQGQARVVLDTGFTKLYQGAFNKTAGTARYFRNIAFWLARGSRGVHYTLLTEARDQMPMLQPGGESPRYAHPVASPTALRYLLHWEGRGTLGLVVQDPQGRIVYDAHADKSPLRVDIRADQPGNWVCWVKGIQLPSANFPYVLTVAEDSKGSSHIGVQTPTVSNHPILQGKQLKPPGERYLKQWGATHPGCVIILLDQSGSMREEFGGKQVGAGKRKCDMVATVLNNLLYELIRANTVGKDVRARIDVAVLGYEGGTVRPILSGTRSDKPFMSLPDLLANPLRLEQRTRREVDDDGNVLEIPVSFPIWVEPYLGTATPMCAAFEHAYRLAEKWALSHLNNYPPVVINITDGASTDGDPTVAAQALQQIHTTEGATLLFNCHITNLPALTVEFPSTTAQIPHDPEGLASHLFLLSSPVPDAARQNILNTTGHQLPVGARGFVFNGDAASVRQMFVFATVGASQPAADPNR